MTVSTPEKNQGLCDNNELERKGEKNRKTFEGRNRKKRSVKAVKRRLFVKNVILAVAMVLLGISVAFNIYLYQLSDQDLADTISLTEENNMLQQTCADLESEIQNHKRTIEEQKSEISEKNDTISKYEEEIKKLTSNQTLFEFYYKNAVVVSLDTSGTYHRYGCSRLDISSGYKIFNISAAKNEGYVPCENCMK